MAPRLYLDEQKKFQQV